MSAPVSVNNILTTLLSLGGVLIPELPALITDFKAIVSKNNIAPEQLAAYLAAAAQAGEVVDADTEAKANTPTVPDPPKPTT